MYSDHFTDKKTSNKPIINELNIHTHMYTNDSHTHIHIELTQVFSKLLTAAMAELVNLLKTDFN